MNLEEHRAEGQRRTQSVETLQKRLEKAEKRVDVLTEMVNVMGDALQRHTLPGTHVPLDMFLDLSTPLPKGRDGYASAKEVADMISAHAFYPLTPFVWDPAPSGAEKVLSAVSRTQEFVIRERVSILWERLAMDAPTDRDIEKFVGHLLARWRKDDGDYKGFCATRKAVQGMTGLWHVPLKECTDYLVRQDLVKQIGTAPGATHFFGRPLGDGLRASITCHLMRHRDERSGRSPV